MFRKVMIAGAAVAALMATSGLASRADAATHHRHHHMMQRHYASTMQRHYASTAARYGEEASAVSPAAALDPYGGPTVIASRPVPDTPGNRDRYGGPMSRGGEMTPPIGD